MPGDAEGERRGGDDRAEESAVLAAYVAHGVTGTDAQRRYPPVLPQG